MQEHGYERMETTEEAESDWTKHVYEAANETLFPSVDSWFMNVNRNLPEKEKTFLLYTGGGPQYRQRCEDIAANDYAGFELR